jgi:hypothetical protein
MRKARRLGKGFIILSALLLMFTAVGCDDSDSTENLRRFDVRLVESGEATRIADLEAGVFSTADVATDIEGRTPETIVTVTVPAGITASTDRAGNNPLGGDIQIVINAYDPNSFRFFPDNEQGNWVTAGFTEIYVLDDDGDRVNQVFFDQDIEIEIDISDNMVAQRILAGTDLPVWRKEANESWDFDANYTLSAAKTITITTDHLSWFLIGFESETDYLEWDEFLNDVCDAIIEFDDDGGNIIDVDFGGSTFADRVNLGYVGNLTEGAEITLYLSFGGGVFEFPLTFSIIDAVCLTGV